jgi:hypothetical protein
MRRPQRINFYIAFLVTFFLALFSSTAVIADEIRPALLEITEQPGGNFEVIWKVPMRGDLVLGLRPVLPEGWTAVGEPEAYTIPGAMVERNTYTSDGQPITGQTLSIDGLSSTVMTDVLLQIKLIKDGVYAVILKPSSPSFTIPSLHQEQLATVIFQNIKGAFGHLARSINHIVLILALVLLASGPRAIKLLIAWVFGHAASLVLVDFGVASFPAPVAEVLCMIAVFLIARSIVSNRRDLGSFWVPVFGAGLFHSLAHAGIVAETVADKPGLLGALFAFNLGLDLGQILLAAAAIGTVIIMPRYGPFPKTRIVAGYVLGSAAVAIGMGIFMNAAALDDPLQNAAASQTLQMPTARSVNMKSPNTPGPVSIQQPKDPVSVFLTIEPYEVRLEVLFRVKDLYALKELDPPTADMISPESQDPLIENVLGLMQDRVSVMINGKPADAVARRGEFVTAGSYGVMTRKQKIPERVDEAIMGVMFAYLGDDLPKEVTLDWDLFLPASSEVKATVSDPLESKQGVLTETAPTLRWQNQLAGFKMPVVKPVPVLLPDIPIISIVLTFVSAIVFALCSLRRGHWILRALAAAGMALAIACYPFVRFKVQIPGLKSIKPAPRQAVVVVDGLLTNVYRSFYLRDEGTIYDRLALTAHGDQLTDIYLQVRTALELEDRGGARARVDQVQIQEVREIKRQADGMFAVDTVWTANGSVSHFGHTHYRQNRYHAIMSIVQDEDTWKIHQIELLDEQRLL